MSSWVLSRERTQKSFPSQAQFPESPQLQVPTSLWMSCAGGPTSSRPSVGLPPRTSESALRSPTTTPRFRFPARLDSTAPTGALFSMGRRFSPLAWERCGGVYSILARSQLRSRSRTAPMQKRLPGIGRRVFGAREMSEMRLLSLGKRQDGLEEL